MLQGRAGLLWGGNILTEPSQGVRVAAVRASDSEGALKR